MNIDNKLDKLKGITRVEAPPFLFTRIKERINSLNEQPAPVKWRFAFLTTAVVLVLINVAILFQSAHKTKSNSIEQVVTAMQLSNSNDFYHE